MRRSEHIGQLAAALAKAQASIKAAVKSADNPFFVSKYAPLSEVVNACREPLSTNELAIMQVVEVNEETSGVEGVARPVPILATMLAHSSGEFIISDYPIRVKDLYDKETGRVKNMQDDPQAFGSALAYARRYSAQAIIFMASDDDDAEIGAGHATGNGKEEGKKNEGKKNGDREEPKDRKGWELELYYQATKAGMKKGKDAKGRDACDFEKLGKWLKETAGLKTSYVKDLSIEDVQAAIHKLRVLTGTEKELEEGTGPDPSLKTTIPEDKPAMQEEQGSDEEATNFETKAMAMFHDARLNRGLDQKKFEKAARSVLYERFMVKQLTELSPENWAYICKEDIFEDILAEIIKRY